MDKTRKLGEKENGIEEREWARGKKWKKIDQKNIINFFGAVGWRSEGERREFQFVRPPNNQLTDKLKGKHPCTKQQSRFPTKQRKFGITSAGWSGVGLDKFLNSDHFCLNRGFVF
jgi:hypothetical protein